MNSTSTSKRKAIGPSRRSEVVWQAKPKGNFAVQTFATDRASELRAKQAGLEKRVADQATKMEGRKVKVDR